MISIMNNDWKFLKFLDDFLPGKDFRTEMNEQVHIKELFGGNKCVWEYAADGRKLRKTSLETWQALIKSAKRHVKAKEYSEYW